MLISCGHSLVPKLDGCQFQSTFLAEILASRPPKCVKPARSWSPLDTAAVEQRVEHLVANFVGVARSFVGSRTSKEKIIWPTPDVSQLRLEVRNERVGDVLFPFLFRRGSHMSCPTIGRCPSDGRPKSRTRTRYRSINSRSPHRDAGTRSLQR